ncbi:MAG: glycosyltransferase [Myxococcales bacterium FL481]|nr:MAG: glycosyltransferase [Myxococcales bacterium FL481]
MGDPLHPGPRRPGVAASAISVVVPTYQRAELTCRALRSVVAQTEAPGEIILVDDGSSDGTAERVHEQFPQVRVIVQSNRGVSAARNRGIRDARGELVALLDSDDEWHPDKLARQVHALSAAPWARLCHTDEVWVRRGRRVNPMRKHQKFGGWIYDKCLPLCAISPSSVLVFRSLLEEVGGFDEDLPACEDYDLWLRICARHPVLFVPEALLTKYGGHDDQLSRRYVGMDRFRIVALERMLDSGCLDDGQRRATLDTLRRKAAVFANGARKRGRIDAAEVVEGKWARFASEWAQATVEADDRR